MTTPLNILVQVPAPRPAPPTAVLIGASAARLLNVVRSAGAALADALRAARPGATRAELERGAAAIEAERPATAVTLRSVAAKGWIY
jgi:hypothetical protein